MLRSILFVLMPIVFFGIFSCKDEKVIKSFEYQVKIDSLISLARDQNDSVHYVDFRILFDEIEWDSIAIVGPYMTSRTLNSISICNSELVRDKMREIASVDWQYGLFFIRKDCFVAYSILTANANFRFSGVGYQLPLIRRTEAVVRLKKRQLENGEFSFYFLI